MSNVIFTMFWAAASTFNIAPLYVILPYKGPFDIETHRYFQLMTNAISPYSIWAVHMKNINANGNFFGWRGCVTSINVCYEITYPFRNFNGPTFEVCKWMSNFIQQFTGHKVIYQRLN